MTLIAEHLVNVWPSPDVFGKGHSYERVMTTEGVDRIKRWEVYSSKKYIDVVDKHGKTWWAIGYGHGGASGVWPSQQEIADGDLVLTIKQATEILAQDLEVEYVPRTSRLIKCNLTNFMLSSMVMTSFNMGITRFAKTSMIHHLNNGKYIAACASLKNYNKAVNPKTLLLEERNGLTCRRMDEGSLFLTRRD